MGHFGWKHLLNGDVTKEVQTDFPRPFPAKSRAIAIPVDLDSQVNNLFVKSNNVVQKSILNWRLSAKNTSRKDSDLSSSKDYRNIIERLQVRRTHTLSVVLRHFSLNTDSLRFKI